MCNSVIDTFDYIVKYIPKHPNTIPKHQTPNQTPSQQSTQNAESSNGAHGQAERTSWKDTLERYFGTIPRKAPAMDIAIPMD